MIWCLPCLKKNSFKLFVYLLNFGACTTNVKMQKSRWVDSTLVVGCLHFTIGIHSSAVLFRTLSLLGHMCMCICLYGIFTHKENVGDKVFILPIL